MGEENVFCSPTLVPDIQGDKETPGGGGFSGTDHTPVAITAMILETHPSYFQWDGTQFIAQWE